MIYLTDCTKQIVHPPGYHPGRAATTGMLSVELGPDEEVEWHYCHLVDGTRMVTGYSIIKKGRIVSANDRPHTLNNNKQVVVSCHTDFQYKHTVK